MARDLWTSEARKSRHLADETRIGHCSAERATVALLVADDLPAVKTHPAPAAPSPLRRSRWLSLQRGVKRVLDVVAATLGLIVLAPVFLVIAVAIKVGSPGPVFYRWRVVGRDGRFFVGHKFRTMVVDADARKAQLVANNEMRGPVFKMTHDPRVTRVGRILRRYSLDELPQLWDVLKNNMSLVGPRPPLQTEWVFFDARQKHKLDVTPGLTCLWQVAGRNSIVDFDDWVNLDLKYIAEWSLWLDFKILARTLATVVRGTGK
jgi:lipopolysaccharide/colanic/teichoic acid biosynthesis glycosyltransferase